MRAQPNINVKEKTFLSKLNVLFLLRCELIKGIAAQIMKPLKKGNTT